MDDDSADSKLSKLAPRRTRTPAAARRGWYQPGSGGGCPVAAWYLPPTSRRRQPPRTGCRRCRDPCGPRVEPDSAESVASMRWKPPPPTTTGARRPCGGCRLRTPGPCREQEEHRERQTPQRDREQPPGESGEGQHQGDEIGQPRPQLHPAFDHQPAAERPRLDGGAHIVLRAGEPAARADRPVGVKVRPGRVRSSAEPTATLTGSTSAQAPASPTLRTVHFFELSCSSDSRPRSARWNSVAVSPCAGTLSVGCIRTARSQPLRGAYCRGIPASARR